MFERRAGRLAAIAVFVVIPGCAARCLAQDQPVPKPSDTAQPADVRPSGTNGTQPGVVQDKHAFGVLPNYRTADGTLPYTPISTKMKFTIAEKDTLDGPAFVMGGFFAAISQMTNSHPSYGQGVKGFIKRYAANTADQAMGNFMTEAIYPTLLHEDPRYFRKINGTVKSRILYAASRVIINKNDHGHDTFNFSEILGNGTVAAIGNVYYRDERGFGPTMQRMGTQVGTDAISQILKEFWPDIKKKYFTHPKDKSGAGHSLD